MTARGAAALAGAAATILLLAACGGSSPTPAPMLDPAHVELAISQSVLKQRHVSASVTCPSGIPLRKGTHFYCVAQIGPKITTFAVTESSDRGAVIYVGLDAANVPLLNTTGVATAIEKSIEAKRKIHARVDCPVGIPRQKGLSFVCTATAKGIARTNFVVRQSDNSGHVTYGSG